MTVTDATWLRPVPDVPRQLRQNVVEDPISNKLREFDNLTLTERESGVYLGTNESGVKASREAINTISRVAHGCHIGFSGWHNFDIVVLRQSSRALICDLNPENAYFLHHTLQIIRASKNRFDFVSQMIAYVNKVNRVDLIASTDEEVDLTTSIWFQFNVSDDEVYRNVYGLIEKEIEIELTREGSWLATDDSFAYMQQLARQDKIALITENILNTPAFQRMRTVLKDNNGQIDSIYVSNIEKFIKSDVHQRQFLETVQALVERETVLIAAGTDTSGTTPYQRVGQLETIGDLAKWFFSEVPRFKDL